MRGPTEIVRKFRRADIIQYISEGPGDFRQQRDHCRNSKKGTDLDCQSLIVIDGDTGIKEERSKENPREQRSQPGHITVSREYEGFHLLSLRRPGGKASISS